MEIQVNRTYSFSMVKFIEGNTVIEIDLDEIDYEQLIDLVEDIGYNSDKKEAVIKRLQEAITYIED